MKDTVNILFVCGYGAGSSLIMKMTAEAAMKKFKINSDTKVTSVGEVNSYFDWADIIAVSEKLAEGIVLPSNKEVKMIKSFVFKDEWNERIILEIVAQSVKYDD